MPGGVGTDQGVAGADGAVTGVHLDLDDATQAEAGLADLVKSLEKDQVIQYKYYRQAGLRWLVEAQMVDNNLAATRR